MRTRLPFALFLLTFACQSEPSATDDAGQTALDAVVAADAADRDAGEGGAVPPAPDALIEPRDAATADAALNGPDAGACPADLFAAVGTPCAPEGAFCGGEGCDPCGFCHVVHCAEGRWEDLEAPPPPPDDPVCHPEAGAPDAGGPPPNDAGLPPEMDAGRPPVTDAAVVDPDAGACPADLFAAEGTPCAPEGAFCGGEACDPCSFCRIVHCAAGRWEGLEAPPPPPDDPACRPDAGLGCCHADADCGDGRHCSGGVCWAGPVPGGPCGCAGDADCPAGAACFDTDVACGVCLPAEQACRD
jgi:hypothetical protein